MTKLSIVMTAYNESHLTQEAILNILNVCRDIDYELIIMDDCSTDDTTDIVASLYPQSE
jgi:glycosyltransferase involved in cell wall biosynthesis